MTYKFTFKGTMPSLNEYLRSERVNVRNGKSFNTLGNVMKHEYQTKILTCIRVSLKNLRITKPVHIHYEIYEPNNKRDCDNILSVVMKFTQDALVQAHVLVDDSRKYVSHVSANIHTDRTRPRIEVSLIEID